MLSLYDQGGICDTRTVVFYKLNHFDSCLEEGAGELTNAYMANLHIQAPWVNNGQLKMHDVVFELMLSRRYLVVIGGIGN